MIKVRNILKEKYNIDTSVKYDNIVGDNGLIKVQIEPPSIDCDPADEHSKWLLRMAPSTSFDRWSVSAAIEKRFENTTQIIEFLCYTEWVYKDLFKTLSKDYVMLSKENERLVCVEADDAKCDGDGWTYETGNGCWSTYGFSATRWVTVNSKDEAFHIQKVAGYNYIIRYKDDRNVRQFWNQFTKQWIEGTIFVD